MSSSIFLTVRVWAFFFINMWSTCISFLHPFVPFVVWQPSVYYLLSSVSYQNKYEMLLIHFPFTLIFLSLSDYAGDWNDKTASQKEERQHVLVNGHVFKHFYILVHWIAIYFNQIKSKSLSSSLSAVLLTRDFLITIYMLIYCNISL